jgi:exopolysaccharide production protein ExoQ
MSRPSMHSLKSSRPKSSKSAFDMCAMMPVLAFAYSAIIQPLLYFSIPPAPGLQGLLESRPENRIFWPAMAAIAVVLAARNLSRGGRLALPPNIIGLIAYVAFAGASVLWAFKPDLTFIRFTQEVMVLTAIVLPALLAARTADIMRGMYLCFAFAALVNVLLLPGGYDTIMRVGSAMVDIGYQGYFSGKNLLGEFAAIAFLLSIYELLYPGHRRVLGIIVAVIAIALLFLSSSKTALGLALLAPFLAALTLIVGRTFRISAAVILVGLTLVYLVGTKLTGFDTDRIAYLLTGDSTFTGRTIIWTFAETEIARSPFLGWGYQGFWLVGPDAPSIVDAPGWVKLMPNAHNGYYDVMLELGYVGLTLLVIFLVTSLHVVSRVADHDYRRAWLLLTVALFIIIYNSLETLWFRAFDMSWVVFVIVIAEAARYWQPSLLKVPAHRPRPATPVNPGRLRGTWRPRLGARS